MARGQRKPIEEKITEKEELINSLSIRLDKEKEELKALLNEQKQQEETLYDFIKTANLSVYEATEVLQQYLSEKYEATA